MLTLLLGDFSGDGRLDWIWEEPEPGSSCSWGRVTAAFRPTARAEDQLEAASTVRHISSADWDQDGDLDLHLALGSGPKVPRLTPL